MKLKKLARENAEKFAADGESAVRLQLADQGIEDADIDDIIEAIKGGNFQQTGTPGDKEGDKNPPPPSSDQDKEDEETQAPGNANAEYDEYRVIYRKDTPGDKDEHFDKVAKVKTVRIPPERAERMNTQSRNSKIRYYAK